MYELTNSLYYLRVSQYECICHQMQLSFVNVNNYEIIESVDFNSPDIPVSSANCSLWANKLISYLSLLIYIPGIGAHCSYSLISPLGSNHHWGICCINRQLLQFSFLIQSGAHCYLGDRGSMEREVWSTLHNMTSGGYQTLDLLIKSITPYPLGHMLPFVTKRYPANNYRMYTSLQMSLIEMKR